MVERARRLRMGLAHSSPGALGVTARPNHVGPSGNGLVKRMNAGRKPCGIKGVRMGAPVRLQKAVPRSKEKRRSGAPRGERPTSLGVRRKAFEMLPAPFGAPLPSPLVREFSPRERGDGNTRRSPRLARTGAAELWLFHLWVSC